MVVISIAVLPLVHYSSKRLEARARHECICDCEACKKNTEKKRKAAAKKAAATRKAKKEHELYLKLKQKYEVEGGMLQ
jgi:hypothetical protein